MARASITSDRGERAHRRLDRSGHDRRAHCSSSLRSVRTAPVRPLGKCDASFPKRRPHRSGRAGTTLLWHRAHHSRERGERLGEQGRQHRPPQRQMCSWSARPSPENPRRRFEPKRSLSGPMPKGSKAQPRSPIPKDPARSRRRHSQPTICTAISNSVAASRPPLPGKQNVQSLPDRLPCHDTCKRSRTRRTRRQQTAENIEADRVSVDDRNKTHTFEGNVVLSQGTLSIRGDRLVVTQNDDGFQKGVATGGRMGAPASGNGAKDAANSSKVWRSGSNTMAAPRKPPCGPRRGQKRRRPGKGPVHRIRRHDRELPSHQRPCTWLGRHRVLVTGQGGHSAQRQQRPRECRAAALDHEIIYSGASRR